MYVMIQKGGEQMKEEIIKFFGITEYEEFGKYLIAKSTSNKGNPVAQIYNTNAKKLHNSKVEGYYFHTETARDEHINEFKQRIQKREDWKAERKLTQKNFKNPAKVGDILDSSWGYDQTNIDFYQVTAVKGKQIVIKPLKQQISEVGETNSMSEYVVPIPNSFTEQTKEITKLVKASYQGSSYDYVVNINSYAIATPWDGKPKYQSHYA